jgi:DNA-binding LacI/PurR family transcriptional regulator
VSFLQGFAHATEEAGLPVLVLPGHSGSPGGELRTLVREAVVGGFCVYSLPQDNPGFAAAAERRLPLVVVDEPRSTGHQFVGIDDRAGARLAAEHVAALGHRRIGVVSFRTTDDGYAGPLTPAREAAATYPVTGERLAGWREGIEAAGTAWEDVEKEERVRNDREEGAAGLRALLARDPALTAVLCATDQMALGVLAAAADAGRGDLSIVGFDDIPAAAARGLTTVRQPLFEKGMTAGRLLVEPPQDPAPREIVLPVELVARASTRPA